MNKPDDITLNRWLNGELEGEELRKMEAWAEENAADLDAEFTCNIGWDALGSDYMKEVAASEEPPYPEFFNHKLQQAIEADGLEQTETLTEPVTSPVTEPSIWQKLRWMVLPTAVAAGVAFYAGSHMTPATDQKGAVQASNFESVYIPDSGVVAAVSETDGATEIVLEGLKPIADELDIVKGETSLGTPPAMMVIQPEQPADQVNFF